MNQLIDSMGLDDQHDEDLHENEN